MAQSLSNVLVHFVFSTKQRSPFLQDEWRHELHYYIIGILTRLKAEPLIVNSVKDHVHMLVPLPRTCTIAHLMQEVKAGISAWIHKNRAHMKEFQWQAGFGAFSVSASHKQVVRDYIANQEAHHQKFSFEEEFVRLLEAYEVKYDEAYLWD